MQVIRRQFGIVFLAVLAGAANGCGKKEAPRLTVFPVSGKLLVNGLPAPRAEVTLRPPAPLQEPGRRSVAPSAIVQDDGTFRIGTYSGDDGAPAGEYAVTIIWPKVSMQGGEEVAGPDRLQGIYNNPGQPITTVVVAEGDNVIPTIEIKARLLP